MLTAIDRDDRARNVPRGITDKEGRKGTDVGNINELA
jgi:hypothetical protein